MLRPGKLTEFPPEEAFKNAGFAGDQPNPVNITRVKRRAQAAI